MNNNKLFNKELSRNGIVHFWDIANNYIILEDKFRNELTKNFMRKCKTIANGSRLSGIPKTTLGRIIRKEKKRIKINFLIKLVGIINNKISLEEVEKNVIWIGHPNSQGVTYPKLPFNFNSRNGARFLAAICNDGWISDGAYYSNSEKELRNSLKKDTLSVFGGNEDTVREWIRKKDQYLAFPSVIRDILLKITKFKGKKSENNPSIPDFIFRDKESICGWIEQTIADEGYVIFFSNKSRRSIAWRRSIDVTKELSKFNFNKNDISIRKLPKGVQKIILNKSFKLINGECYILNKLGIFFKVHNLGIYITKKGKIKTRFEIYLTGRKNLIKLRKLITIPCSSKENKFTGMMKDFVKYKEPLKIKNALKKIHKDMGYITSVCLKKEMNYKNISCACKWLSLFEKEGFIHKIGYEKGLKGPLIGKYIIKW